MGVKEVLEGGAAVCVVVGEGSLWRVLCEDNAAPCGYVGPHWWSVGYYVKLRVEVCLFLVELGARHSVAEYGPVTVVYSLELEGAVEERVGWCWRGAELC